MKRDFSETSKQELIQLVSQVEGDNLCDFTDWMGDRWYDFESWIGDLDIQHYIDDVNAYHKKVIDKNNTTVQEIKNIFNKVKEVDTSYSVRMSACREQLEAIASLITEMTRVIEPTQGIFHANDINANLSGFFVNYTQNREILLLLSQNGLSQKDIEGLEGEQLQDTLKRVIAGIIDALPNVKLGEKLETPIGPDVTLYYLVSGEYDNGSNINIDLVISDQRVKLKEISYTSEIGAAIEFGGNLLDGDIEVSAETDKGSVSFSLGGECEMKGQYKDGNTTHTVKTSFSHEKIIFEESVTTTVGKGKITSAIGIEKENRNDWVPCPVPVQEAEIEEIPQIEDAGIDWETVTFITGGLLFAGGLVLAIPTGGTSLGLCVL